MGEKRPLIQMTDIHRHYTQGGQRVDVLRGASLVVHAGELTALVGPSGCGKSTLLNIAGLLEKPTAGDVIIDGTSTAQLSQWSCGRLRRSHIGFIFQFHRLLAEFSAIENVMIPQMLNGLTRAEARDRAKQLLAMVGLADRHDHRPGTLSGGEQQRVAVARSVANAPRILLADEPTGNLDPETADEVFEHIANIVQATDTAALIVTHNHGLAITMNRTLTIRNGAIESV